MVDGALQHPLKRQRRLHLVAVGIFFDDRHVLTNKAAQVAFQCIQADTAGPQHLGDIHIIEQGQQKMLNGEHFVALVAGSEKRRVECLLQFLAQHIVHPYRVGVVGRQRPVNGLRPGQSIAPHRWLKVTPVPTCTARGVDAAWRTQ